MPVTRKPLHTRRIELQAYERSDGLFEVEGRVVDTKPYDFVPIRGTRGVPAGQAIHDLGVVLAFDAQLRVHEVRTISDAYPYAECPEGGRALQSLVGLSMTRGWNSEVRQRLGGERSCTHLRELLGPMATAAFQAMSVLRASQPEKLDAQGRPLKIDSCYAYGAERELVRVTWPQFHRPQAD